MSRKATPRDPRRDVLEAFDEATDPKIMSKEEYVEFTEDLIVELQVRLEAARGELEEEEG